MVDAPVREEPAAADPPSAWTRRAAARLGHERAIWVVVALQAGWLGWNWNRGWFLQSDLSNMSEVAGADLDWNYLSGDLGGHFAPMARLVYWVLVNVSPLDYGLSVVLRVVLQAAATVLLYRLLRTLTGRPAPAALIVIAYALNPVLAAGTAMFTPGMTVLLGQVLVLAALLAHLRSERDGSLRQAVLAGVLFALALTCSVQWIVAVAVPPLISLVALRTGPLLGRLRGVVAGWLLQWAPIAVVALAAARLADPVGAETPGPGALVTVLRRSWFDTLGPSFVGGPFRWYGTPTNYIGFASPVPAVVIIGQVAVVAVVVGGVLTLGWRSLFGWLVPLVTWVGSVVLVAYRGYADYGALVAITPRYYSALIVFFAIGAALAYARPDLAADIGDTADATADEPTKQTPDEAPTGRWRDRRGEQLVGAGVAAVLLVGATVSGVGYSQRFARLPAERYVDNLVESARLADGTVNVYDTDVPSWLIAGYEPRHRVSDLLHLADVDANVERTTSAPLVAAPDGHLVKAAFVAAGSVPRTAGPCGTPVNRSGAQTFRLDAPVRRGEWWVHIAAYQQTPSDVRIDVVYTGGRIVSPVSTRRVRFNQLTELNARLPAGAPVAVRVTPLSPDPAMCLATISIGAPFPAGTR